MAPRKRTPKKPLPASFGFNDPTINAAIGGSSNPLLPSGTTDMVLAGKGGYTKLSGGKLVKGTYVTANLTPYRGQPGTPVTPTPFSYNGKRIGLAGPEGWSSTLTKASTGPRRSSKAGGGKVGKTAGKRGGKRGLLGDKGGPTGLDYYAEADTTTTANVRAQGKAYGRGAGEGAFGATAKKDQGESATKKKKGKGKPKGPKAVKLAKARGSRKATGAKPGTHVTKAGTVVKNKGKRK